MMRILEPYVVSGPAVEPLGVDDVKTHLRIDVPDEDVHIGLTLIRGTRMRTEAYLNRALITQTLEVSLDGWWGPRAELALPRAPLQSVTSIKYTDDQGVEATLDSGNYYADTRQTPGTVVMKASAVLPTVTLRESGAIVVRYVAGFGASGLNVPEDIRLAMLLWIGEAYENRENTAPPGGLTTIPSAAERLLAKWRVF